MCKRFWSASLPLLFAIALPWSGASAQTFSNTAPITIPAGAPGTTVGPANPYPSTISVSGLTGTITNISVAINGYEHTFPDDVDVLLVGPAGTGAQSVVLMSDVGGGDDITGVNLVIQDGSPAMPDSTLLTSGTYGPTNYGTGDAFAAPAPAGPHGATFASLGLIGGPASAANGTWSLYVVDDASLDVGAFTGGWSITFTTGAPNVPPQFGYTPAPSSTVTATGGTGIIGSTSNLSIAVSVATAGSGTGAPATTTLTCTAPTAPFAGFGQTVTATGSGAISGGPLSGTCTRGATAVTQTLTCSENQGGTPVARTWTLNCPAGTAPVATVPVDATSVWSLIALMLALFGFAAVAARRQG
jgi:subtilisin-like proprotein convertase family protein